MTAQKKREILTGGIAALLIVCAVAASAEFPGSNCWQAI